MRKSSARGRAAGRTTFSTSALPRCLRLRKPVTTRRSAPSLKKCSPTTSRSRRRTTTGMSPRTPSMPSRSSGRVSRALRWLAATGWTVLVVVLMLMPGQDSAADDLSSFFGGTDIPDAIGDVVPYGVLILPGLQALAAARPRARSLRWAVALGLAAGLVGDLLHVFIPRRGVSLLDQSANA